MRNKLKDLTLDEHIERWGTFKKCRRALDENFVCHLEREIFIEKLLKENRRLEIDKMYLNRLLDDREDYEDRSRIDQDERY